MKDLRISVRILPKLDRQLRRACKARRVRRSDFVIQAVERAVTEYGIGAVA